MTPNVERLEANRTILAMWIGALGPPIVWAIHLALLYVLATALCAPGTIGWLYTITFAALALDIVAGVIACRCYLLTRRFPRDADRAVTRTRFFGLTGMLASAIFAFGIVAQVVPIFLYDACA